MCLFCAILLGLSGKLTTTVQGMTRNGARCESDFIDPLLHYSNRQHMHVCVLMSAFGFPKLHQSLSAKQKVKKTDNNIKFLTRRSLVSYSSLSMKMCTDLFILVFTRYYFCVFSDIFMRYVVKCGRATAFVRAFPRDK